MFILRIILLLAFVNVSLISRGQVIDTSVFEKLRSQNYLPYKDKSGRYLGCGYTYECRGMSIVFYEIKIDRKKHLLFVKGRVIDSRSKLDSSGIYAVNILLATPHKNELTQIRILAKTKVGNDVGPSLLFPNREGDFLFRCKFNINDRLYFIHELFRPIEYSINKLL